MTTILLTLLAGIFYGVMWHVQFRRWKYSPISGSKHWENDLFVSPLSLYWWNVGYSWENKYKNRDASQGPAFPGSTWIFVFLTDAFHFFQMLTFLTLGMAFYWHDLFMPINFPSELFTGLIHAFIWSSIFSTGFTISFKLIETMFNAKKINTWFTGLKLWQKGLYPSALFTALFLALAGIDYGLDYFTGSDKLGEIVVPILATLAVVYIVVLIIKGKK